MCDSHTVQLCEMARIQAVMQYMKLNVRQLHNSAASGAQNSSNSTICERWRATATQLSCVRCPEFRRQAKVDFMGSVNYNTLEMSTSSPLEQNWSWVSEHRATASPCGASPHRRDQPCELTRPFELGEGGLYHDYTSWRSMYGALFQKRTMCDQKTH